MRLFVVPLSISLRVMPGFSRQNPSPDYEALIALYRDLHLGGDRSRGTPAEKTFAGISLLPFVQEIEEAVDRFGARTILDYGSGKGKQYEPQGLTLPDGRKVKNIPDFWQVKVTCYDPGYPPHMQLPKGRFDGVVCTDVLEHCPKEDIPWIVDEIFSFARKFVFATVATYPAKKSLPDGRNAHVTIESPEWWRRVFDEANHENLPFCLTIRRKSDSIRSGHPVRRAIS